MLREGWCLVGRSRVVMASDLSTIECLLTRAFKAGLSIDGLLLIWIYLLPQSS